MNIKSIVIASIVCAAFALTPQRNAAADAGLQPGDPIGAFYVVKAAGAEDDGVEVGDELCYRCKFGSSPMAMVFTRSTDKHVQDLINGLNASATKHSEDRFRTLVVMLGDDPNQLRASAVDVAASTTVNQTPIVVPVDNETGPLSYRIGEADEVTIVMAQDSQVQKVISGASADISVDAVTKGIEAMLSE